MGRRSQSRSSQEGKGSYETSYNVVVQGSPQVAQQMFRKTVWDDLGFQSVPLLNMLPSAGVVEKGDENGVGAIRAVPGAWMPMMHEEVLSVEPGKKIVYRVKSGPFPASFHQGQVDFEDAGDGNTLVTWSVTFTAYKGCEGLCRFLVWFMFPNGLEALRLACKKEATRKAR